MKYGLFVFLCLSLILINHQSAMSQGCTDPAGCSAVSFAAFQNTVGVIQFGNSTGRVVSKKKTTLCPEGNCNSLFVMTTALVGPRATTPGVSTAAQAADVTLLMVRRPLTSAQTSVFRNTLDLPTDGFRAVTARTKFSSVPFTSGFGNNAISFLVSSGVQTRIVAQVFNKTANSFVSTVTQVANFANELAAGISREGEDLVWANRKDAQTINLNVRPINSINRRPAGATEVFALNMPVSSTLIQTISSLAISNFIQTSSPGLTAKDDDDGHNLLCSSENERKNGKEGRKIKCRKHKRKKRGHALEAVQLDPPTTIASEATTIAGSAPFFQSVAMDPKGRFIVYAGFSPACKKLLMKFQRLNPLTGGKIGGPKVLVGCPDVSTSSTGVYGLNVINLE
jgi:hypothetical protein